jgi:uncharacterized protein
MRESNYNIWVERGDAGYVFNGISGALLRIPKEHYYPVRDFLACKKDVPVPPKLLAYLAEGLMIIPDDADEVALLAKRYQASRYSTSAFALTIVTSLGCNFDCPYCFEAKHPSIMAEEVQQIVLQVLDDQLPKVESFRVTWYGGEPLVGKRAILALSDVFIDHCERAQVNYRADITTNGYLLDKETCVQLRNCRVQSAQVSLDGPPKVHDKMRPLVNGRGTFWRIVGNLHHAVDYLNISIRVNLDRENFADAEELLKILAVEGFAGKLSVYPAQLVAINDGVPSPSATYKRCCFRSPEFARAELEFITLARQYGFIKHSLPIPVGAPCTAVRANELVVGSKGELYKCWDSVGNRLEVIGDIRDYQNPNGRLQKWLKYNPFADTECRSCIALPVCMGGCAHHAMDPMQYENRCGTFRHTYREQVLAFVESAEHEGFTGLMSSAQLIPRMETR